ncbi:MAG TPA: GDYXXLXY domain-containing protein [Phycisphaerae bacterium]|nr:GDYXXLXY domain-containing protein [Phycisphaerae bacterium]
MTRRAVVLGLFAVLAVAQLAASVGMIARQELVLRHGRVYKFRAAPVDPFDALRGRFVALGFESNTVPKVEGFVVAHGDRVYALVEEDADGFARLTGLVRQRPPDDAAIPVTVNYTYRAEVRLELPFDRYYLEEDIAPEAEAAYRQRAREGNRDAYVTVRVWKGHAVLEELYVGGKPILEFLREGK